VQYRGQEYVEKNAGIGWYSTMTHGSNGEANSRRSARGLLKINSRLRHMLSVVLAVLALLVLAAGSTFVAAALIGIGTEEGYVGARYDVAFFAVLLIWLPVLLVVWLLETAALLLVRQLHVVGFLLAACGLTAVVSLVAIYTPHLELPVQGASAVLVVLLFLALNAGAIYFTWQYILAVAHYQRRHH
jgi:hypothetical protein